MSKLKKIIFAGLMIAIGVILNRFLSIKMAIISINFSFVPIILSGIILGPWWTMIIGGMVDLIGALLFPFGAYFVGYTITSALTGLIYGLLLYRKKDYSPNKFLARLIISVLIVNFVLNLGINSIWIYITTKKAIWGILPTRLISETVMTVVKVLIMVGLDAGLQKMGAYKMFELAQESNGNKQSNAVGQTQITGSQDEIANDVDNSQPNSNEENDNVAQSDDETLNTKDHKYKTKKPKE